MKDRIMEIARQERRATAERALLQRADFLEVAERFRQVVTSDEYDTFLLAQFETTRQPSPLHLVLSELEVPMYITTNYDKLLQLAISRTQGVLPRLCWRYDQVVVARKHGVPFIVHLHGAIDEIDSLVFSERDYARLEHERGDLLDYVRQEVDLKRLLFVGYSLSDPDLRAILHRSRLVTLGHGRDDFAVLRRVGAPQVAMWRSRGVEAISVKSYDEVGTLLRSLTEAAQGRGTRGVAAPPEGLALREIRRERRGLRAMLAGVYRHVDVIGLPTSVAVQEFVVERLASVLETEAPLEGGGISPATYHLPRDAVGMIARTRRLILVGDAGSGKSMLAVAMAQELNTNPGSEAVGVVVSAAALATAGSVQRALAEALKPTGSVLQADHVLARHEVVLYVDGLDEVPQAEQTHVTRLLDDEQREHDGLRVVVTTRPEAMALQRSGREFLIAKLHGLWDEDAEVLVTRWATVLGGDVVRIVGGMRRATERIPQLRSNPLMVIAVAEAIQAPNVDLTSRSAAIGSIVARFLERGLQRNHRLRTILSVEQTEDILAAVACRLWLDGERRGSDSVAWQVALAEALGEESVELSSDAMLHFAVADAALVLRGPESRRRTRVEFVSRLFMEYLVARHLAKTEVVSDFAHQHAGDPAWEGVLRFACGLMSDHDQADLVTLLWVKNPGLALRVTTDGAALSLVPDILVARDSEDDIVALIRSLQIDAGSAPDLVELLEPLFSRQVRNGHTLYFAVRALEDLAQQEADTVAGRRATSLLSQLWSEAARLGAKPALVIIPRGQHSIGDERGDTDEQPRHDVDLDSYAIGRAPVTNREYSAFAPTYTPERHSEGDDMPVTSVTWYEADLYSRWLLGGAARLPTEAEWEAAARGGASDGRRYPWGDDPDTSRANFGRSIGRTTRIGDYLPNAFGLLDAAGNVFEWCNDWFDPSYYEVSPRENPSGPSRGRYKVMRGGCWARSAEVARCSYRVRQIPATRDILVGFRLCKPQA